MHLTSTTPNTQADFIEIHLLKAADEHPDYTVSEIITLVANLGYLRPTIRRVKSKLISKMKRYTEILEK